MCRILGDGNCWDENRACGCRVFIGLKMRNEFIKIESKSSYLLLSPEICFWFPIGGGGSSFDIITRVLSFRMMTWEFGWIGFHLAPHQQKFHMDLSQDHTIRLAFYINLGKKKMLAFICDHHLEATFELVKQNKIKGILV